MHAHRPFVRSALTFATLALVHCGGGDASDAGADHPQPVDVLANHDVPSGSDVASDTLVVDDTTPTDTPIADDTTPPDDARPMDAGTDVPVVHDSGPTDGGRDYSTDTTRFGLGTGSRCSTAHLQLCENFETGSLDTGTWHTTGTAPSIDAVHTARGSHALHILQHGNGASYIAETRTFPATNNTYWGRMFVYFHQLPLTAMGYSHWTFAAASGTNINGEIRLSAQLHGNPDVNNFGVGTDSSGHTGDWTNSNTDSAGHLIAVPQDRWLCIEWLHDGQHNVTRFFQDAVEQTSIATTATMHGNGSGGVAGAQYILPDFNRVWVGWQEYQSSSETFELWMDEVAIDPQRIGCVL